MAHGDTAVGYVRASTTEQHLTPHAQREALEAHCRARGLRLVAVYEDLGVSGGTPVDRRPGLLSALGALRSHGASVLVVAKRDRLARDVVVAALAERLVERTGARVVSADGVGDGDGPEAQLMRRIVDAFGEYERALIRSRTRAALAAKRARGERANGTVAYGERLSADGVHVEPDPTETKVVKRIKRMRSRGMSIRRIAERLNDQGVPCRGSRWHPTTVARVLGR